MLKHLHIQNYALIEQLDIDFEKGFSVITGETGAGKSILLGAIGLLLGQRADTKAIRVGAQRCTIEATFSLQGYQLQNLFEEMDIDYDENECLVRRELTSAGKSRAFINDTPTGVAQLKVLGDHLIDIHSQHQNLLLAKEDFQLNVLDILAKDTTQIISYRSTYNAWRETKRALEEAREAVEKQQEEQDYITFQLQQLDEAELREGEDEELETEQKTLLHAEEIKSALFQSCDILNGDNNSLLQALRNATHQLEAISGVYAKADELSQRIESCRIELKDVAEELESEAEDVDFNPQRQAYVEERLDTIYQLQHKHHVESVSELIALTEELRSRLHAITHSEEHIAELEKELATKEKQLIAEAKTLTELRQQAATAVEKAMVETLIPLGMPNIRFKVELTQRSTPDSNGFDKASFLFSANKGGTMQPISQVASGGEIARVMLSLKSLISGTQNLPTIIFDEIDTGVSGTIAERMALIMQQMGKEHGTQVISITHLPQIAALGAQHYRVYKEDNDDATNSHIVRLSDEERIEEIAHMLSGATISEAARNNARALLNKK